MILRKLQKNDVHRLWQINEEGLPGVGKVSEAALEDLLCLSKFPIGAVENGQILGFMLCLLPRTRYKSPNYAWFNQRHENFLYVDRIAVSTLHRNRQIGTLLYKELINESKKVQWPIAAEVSKIPPNPGSMRFHERHGFAEVGTLKHKRQTVTMMMRNLQ